MVNVPIEVSAGLARTHSSVHRNAGHLNGVPGWIPSGAPKGQWMQFDLGKDKKVSGVVVQARGNTGHGSMTYGFSLKYSKSAAPDTHATVPGVFAGPTGSEWTANKDHRTTVMLPAVIEGRYIRFVIESHPSSMVAMRAGILLHSDPTDPFVGKHQFRRCLESDRYLKLVKAGTLTWAQSQARGDTTPQDIKRSVSCPGCYQCREVPIAPNTGKGSMYKSVYGPFALYQGSSRISEPFNSIITNPGMDNAVLEISLPEPFSHGEHSLTWDTWDPEFMCRISPDSDAGSKLALEERLEPDLVDDDEWATFLMPGLGTKQADPTRQVSIKQSGTGYTYVA